MVILSTGFLEPVVDLMELIRLKDDMRYALGEEDIKDFPVEGSTFGGAHLSDMFTANTQDGYDNVLVVLPLGIYSRLIVHGALIELRSTPELEREGMVGDVWRVPVIVTAEEPGVVQVLGEFEGALRILQAEV